MKKKLLSGAVMAFALSAVANTTPVWADRQQEIMSNLLFSTKFGEVTFVNERGEPDELAVDVKLNGKTILTSANRTDASNFPQHLLTSSFLIPYQVSKKAKRTDLPRKIDLLLVSEGPDENCIHDFIILDFTGDKPFVSERFGYDQRGETCLTLNKIKWGETTVIYIEGPWRFIYKSHGSVKGPLP